MEQTAHKPRTADLPARLGAIVAALLCLGLLSAAPASGAALEQVGTFAGILEAPEEPGVFPEEMQLGGVGGMAVNYTGAGGVPAGTVYAATKGSAGGTVRVAVFKPAPDGGDPGEDGELEFSLGWEVTVQEEAYERCGPSLTPTPTECKPRADAARQTVDVDVDQSTGNLYVYNATVTSGRKAIVAYKPDGSEVLARFGEIAPGSDKTAESPEKIHQSPVVGMLAVNEAGGVYVFDRNPFDNGYHRLMKFEPKTPGDYSEYVYAGTGEDIGAGFNGEGSAPWQPVLDAAGDIYVTSQSTKIEKYDATASSSDPPVCSYEPEKGGIAAITVNPASGEVFFFSYRIETGFTFKTVHQLAPCDEETGEFEEVGLFEARPERDDIWALAFDPVRQLSPSRSPGVLYGAAPGSVPSLASGKGEPGLGSLGYVFAPLEESPPVVQSQLVAKVTTTSAELQARIHPKGFKTHYAFQYITEAAYTEGGETFAGASEAPPGGAFLDGTGEPQNAAVTLTGLAPDTAYRYRVVAESECAPGEPGKVCEVPGAAQAFHTFPVEPPGLPDNRVYELVSPAQKNGGQVLPADPRVDSCGPVECKQGITWERFPMRSSPAGDAVVYQGTAFAFGEGATIENEYLARRTATGWQSVNLTPPLLTRPGYRAFDTELSEGVLMQEKGGPALSPEAPPKYENLYAQPTADPLSLATLLKAEPPNRSTGEFEVRYTGAAADLSRVFFEANDALTEETPFAPAAQSGGVSERNLYEWERATGQLRLVNVKPGNTETEPGAAFGQGSAQTISADGRRAFWSDGTGQVYVREDAESTREIPDAGKFLSAAVDGSRVLLDNGHIYDPEAEETIDLTGGAGGFQGLVGQSENLSHAYFVDTEVLTGEEENSEGAKAQTGKFNLYAWNGGTTSFVATLAAGDNSIAVATGGSWVDVPSGRTAQASPDGRFVAFLSRAQLTGHGNVGPCEEFPSGSGEFAQVPCPEAFLYDSATGELTCASCNPSGARPLGWSLLRLIAGPGSLPQARYLTDSGRLYFDSQDSLSLADTNEGVEDVYQYEPEGVGTCKRAGGCVSLISAGTEGVDSNFLAADETGKNVFFTTRDRLRQKDTDELVDLYVAREGGGIAAETETTQPICQGEACLPAAIVPENPPIAFNGPGNVKLASRCKKGQVRRRGRCTKRVRHARDKRRLGKKGKNNHNRGGKR